MTNGLEDKRLLSKHYLVPHIAVPRFFGREKLITELQAFLLEPQGPNDKPNVAVLQALGGQGKSQIALDRHEATKALGRYVRVPSMMHDGGIELLLRDMSDKEIESNRATGEDIVRRLGGLALAIEQAAAYISFNRMALRDFKEKYEKKKLKMLKHMREELWEYRKQRDGSEQSEALNAFTTWEMSFEQVEQHNERRKN
ncbi:hypothetical protein GQ43DRAFT_380312, partial [Delitschia confertaspora ATCC 74209]